MLVTFKIQQIIGLDAAGLKSQSDASYVCNKLNEFKKEEHTSAPAAWYPRVLVSLPSYFSTISLACLKHTRMQIASISSLAHNILFLPVIVAVIYCCAQL